MPFTFSGAAGGLLLLAALLILPVALFVRPLAALATLMALSFAAGLLLLAGNYFWPVAGAIVVIGIGLAWRRGRLAAVVREDADRQMQIERSESRGGLSGLLIGVPIVLALIGGWLFVFLPELSRVVPILPADSPADVLSWQRIVQDLQTNRVAPLFIAPWIGLMIWSAFPGRGDSER